MIYQKEREAVAAVMRRLYRHGLTTCSGGNISLRVSPDHILITPSALDKGTINFRQVALMTLAGENMTPGLRPSIETDMHLQILRARPDTVAVVHAHPKMASFHTAAGAERVRSDLTAEARYLLGEPAFAPYALMGTAELGTRVRDALGTDKTVVLLENHGVLTTGATLLQAFDRMEVLEAAAHMTHMAALAGSFFPLDGTRLKEIDDLH